MIIDTHAHLTYKTFRQQFNYADLDENGAIIVKHGTLGDVFSAMRGSGVQYSIEPAVGSESNRAILDFCEKTPTVFPALGWHPKRLGNADRRTLSEVKRMIAENAGRIVAVGEIGLDHHVTPYFVPDRAYKRKERRVFRCLLNAAHRAKRPLILHIREADGDALRILRRFARRKKLHGGVVHCFCGDAETAKRYVELGFCLGIGGTLLGSERLAEAVKEIALDRLLLETDSPYVLPRFDAPGLSAKAKRRVRNTPAILPMVVERIAELKDVSPAEVERQTARNAICVFGLPVEIM